MNIAQISTDGNHQIVILPEGFQLVGNEVYIKKMGTAIVLVNKENPWESLFNSLEQFSEDFMSTRDQPPLDVREAF
ncbi:MAG: AbrB/MazE/SpoVT family DNA-binding domain-containing protein [Merismopedia sp. SIO2A8]|nr:AbrB/MazE/SpoVT family DNA-binding domain-containing protein [Symploca sp. SIO2B6]NET51895.1 AbrB/MazE/SpoVT family DNA-binding domain-containing protein [Merismopedia sp. SIO2A8]